MLTLKLPPQLLFLILVQLLPMTNFGLMHLLQARLLASHELRSFYHGLFTLAAFKLKLLFIAFFQCDLLLLVVLAQNFQLPLKFLLLQLVLLLYEL
jgi:hypothetical protein